MIFLIQYDCSSGNIVKMQTFKNSERQKANDSRLDIEIELNRQRVEREVVLLEAESKEAMRQTHRRYFENLRELTKSPTYSL
ncbi:MAG: hypothetical protein ACLQF0_07095 [Dissulfurispiraceae bacterium]